MTLKKQNGMGLSIVAAKVGHSWDVSCHTSFPDLESVSSRQSRACGSPSLPMDKARVHVSLSGVGSGVSRTCPRYAGSGNGGTASCSENRSCGECDLDVEPVLLLGGRQSQNLLGHSRHGRKGIP